MHKRSLFFILILFLILFSTSFVCASENLTYDNTNGKMALSVEIDSIDDEGLNEINSDSISLSSDSTLGQVDDAQNSDEIENESCLAFDEKVPVLGVSNDEPVLGATVPNRITDTGQLINWIKEQSDVDIFLGNKTFTGSGQWGSFNGVSNKHIYGGYAIGDGLTSYFDVSGIVFHSTSGNCNNLVFDGIKAKDRLAWFSGTGGSLTNSVFRNCECRAQFIWLGGWYATDQYRVINVNFTNCRQTYGLDDEQEYYDGHGQFGAVSGIYMENCNFVNVTSGHHGGALCIADESEYGSHTTTNAVQSNIINTNFINVTSRWFAVYLHGSFSTSEYFTNVPQTIENCHFINCSGTGEYSGGIGISHDDVQIKNCEFTNCDGGQGSAIMVGGIPRFHDGFNGQNFDANNVLIQDCTFTNNIATLNKTQTVTNGLRDPEGDRPGEYKHDPENFTASGDAGAVYVNGSDTKIINCIFDGNSAESGCGAAVYISGDRTLIQDSKFYNHISKNGTVYIKGNDAQITESTFEDNQAENGAGVFIVGNNAHIEESTFNNNNVSNQGGAIYIDGSNSWISKNNFTNNEAVPQDSSASGTTGLGGAFYVEGDNTMSGDNVFTHNKARNGSAIYSTGKNFNLYYDSFNENQAWSYLLIVTPDPEESYYNTSDVNVTICHVGGDNIINAIHNTASPDQIHFHSVTYKHSNGNVITTGGDETPVAGAENSNNGAITYQDDRENLQKINIIKIVCDETGEVIFGPDYEALTNITGEIRVTLRKPIQKGHYTVYAEHPEDWNYKAISNVGVFEILGLVDLSTEKTSDKTEYYVGETVTWTITVHNANNATRADNITLKDVLPSEVTFVSATATNGTYDSSTNTWTIKNMTNGSSATLTIVTTAIKDGNNVINSVSVSCDDEDWNLSNNDANATIKIKPLADLQVIKVVSKDIAHKGETVVWTITVRNNGPSKAENVRVNDVIPSELTYTDSDVVVSQGSFANGVWTIGDMENDTEETLTISTVISVTNDNITNVAVVESDTYDPDLTNNEDNDTVEVPPEADLSVVKEASVEKAHIGDTVIWTIKVTNKGPDTAVDAYVEDVIPSELTNATVVSVSKGNFTGSKWTIGNLTNGETVTLVVKTTVAKSNVNITNVALVNSSTYDPNETNNKDNDTVEVPPEADLSVVKEASVEKAHIGDTVIWTVTVTNNGPDAAKGVYVSDVIPGELSYSDSDVDVSQGFFANGVWTIDDMENGDRVVMTVTAAVSVSNVNITNVALVNSSTYDPNETNNKDNDTVEVPPEADLSVVKEASVERAHVGDSVIWTIKVTNNGPDTAVDAYVDDVIPDELSGVKVVEVSKGNFTGSKWTIGNLTSGGTAYLIIETTVDKSNATVTNVAVVNSSTYDPNVTNNEDNDTVEVPPEADLMIHKDVSVSEAHVGDVVTWLITVINNGYDTAVDAYVEDVIPSELTNVTIVRITQGNFTGSKWTIGNLTQYKIAYLEFNTTITTSNVNITNVAVVNSSTYDSNENNNKDNDTVEVPPEADLSVVKEASVERAHVGDVVIWTVIVTNNGPDTAVDAYVDEVFPSGLTEIRFISVTQGNFTGNRWTIGNLTNGKNATLVFASTVAESNVNITNVVLVNSSTYDPNLTNNEANDTVKVSPEADLAVEKTVDVKEAHIGDAVEWTITVTNKGPDSAVDAYVEDVIPSELTNATVVRVSKGNFTGSKWTIGNLTNGETVTLVVKTTVAKSNVNITNVALVNSSTYDPNETNNKDNDTVEIPPEADLEIIKEVSSDAVHYGDTVTWTVTLVNKGPDSAVNVSVKDVLPKELIYSGEYTSTRGEYKDNVWFIEKVDNDETLTLVINTTVNATSTTIVNVVNVTSDTYDPNETNNNDSNKTYVSPEADLEIVKLVSNASAHKGDIINWTIIVTNHGIDTAENVVVNETVPDGLIVLNVIGGEIKDGVWTIGSLARGKNATLIIETQINTSNKTIVNIVNVTSDTYDPVPENNNATNQTIIPPEADLSITKTVSDASAHKGDVVTWTIVLVNKGPDAAINVSVTDVIPDTLVYGADDVSVDRGSFKDNVWFIEEVAKGETLTLTVKTTVDTTNDTIVNVVNVTSDTYDPNKTNNNATNKTVIPPEADLEVIITNNYEESGDVCHKGDEIVWTITVTNHGPDDAINSILKDVLPDGIIYVSHDTANGTYDNESAVWTIGDLPVGETVTLTIVSKANTTNKTINRDVSVSSDTYDPDLSNNEDDSSVDIPPEADLQVNITNNYEENGTSAHKGDEVIWTITVTNNGPDDAINTILKDILPDGLIYVSDDSDGAYDNESAVWTIGDLPVGETVTLTIKTLLNTSNTTITKEVSVSSDTYDPDLSNNKDNSSVDVIPEADLEIIKVVSNQSPHKNDKITWTIIVKNNGGDTAVNTVVTDKLPSGVVYVSDDSNGTYDNKAGIWKVGDLAKGESATLNIVVLVKTTNKTIVNAANATSDTYDPNEDNNKCNSSITVPPEADLVLTIEPSATKVTVGDKVDFTITVVNQGPDTAVNTRAYVKLPAGLKLVNFKPSKGTYDPKTGIWTIGDLAPGEKVTLILNTKALVSGKFVIDAYTVCDTYESDLTNNNDTAEIEVVEPEVSGDKSPAKGVPANTMHATGNPILMVLLALLSIAGFSLRRKS